MSVASAGSSAASSPASSSASGYATQRIAIIAPGGYDADPERQKRAEAYFTRRGHRVMMAPEAETPHLRFSDCDAARLAAIERVVSDPAIDLVMALRGGYGLTRLLPALDFNAIATSIRRHGKRFVGHSDFTAFHLALLASSSAISFAGPMASYDFGGEEVDPFTEEHFWRAMSGSHDTIEFDVAHADLATEGILWGGNLAMICSLLGTPWLPRIQGGILFVEEINEHPYRVERMLLQLLQAGVLDRQSALLCGDFSNYRLSDYDNGYDLDAAFDYVRSVAAVPVVRGLPFGHCPKKLTLPIGGMAQVAIADGRCRLDLAWDLRT